MKKRLPRIFTILILLGVGGCFQSEVKKVQKPITIKPESIVSSILLTSSKTKINADGVEIASFSVEVRDQNNVTMTGIAVDFYTGTTKILGNTFKTTTSGSYKIIAKSGSVVSNEITLVCEGNSAPQLTKFLIAGSLICEVEQSTKSAITLSVMDGENDKISSKITVDSGIIEKIDELNYNYTPIKTDGNVIFKIELSDTKGAINTQEKTVEIFKPGSITFMVYMAADNNLNSNDSSQDMAGLDLSEIKNAEINSRRTNVVIFGDFLRDYQNKMKTGIYVKESNTLVQKITYTALDTGNKENLKILLNYTKENYPADRYILSLWGHGSGWLDDNISGKNPSIRRAIGYDAGIGNSWLDLWEVEDGIKESIGNIDILYTDACLMGGIEFCYQVKDVAKYVCASPELTPGPGGDYKGILEFLDLNSKKSSLDLAIGMQSVNMEGYKIGGSQYEYSGWRKDEQDNVVFSVVDTNKIAALKQKIDDFALLLKRSENIGVITNIRENILTYNSDQSTPNEPDFFVDIGSFSDKVAVDIGASQELKLSASNLSIAVNESVAYCTWQNGFILNGTELENINEEGTSGISIFIDLYKTQYSQGIMGYVGASKFAIDSQAWVELLKVYSLQ